MPCFSYSAIDGSSGRECHGRLESASRTTATSELKARGLYPTALVIDLAEPSAPAPGTEGPTLAVRIRRGYALPWRESMSRPTRALFTRELAVLVRAGMPLLRGLDVLARQEHQPGARHVISRLAETIRSGGSLSDALRQHPRIFDQLYVNMVRAGEAGGALELVLERLAQFLEKAERTRGQVKAAMMYPVVIMIVAAGIVGALMVFVIPKFEAIFRSLLKDQPLPALTQGVIAVSTFVKDHVAVTLMGVLLVCAGLAFLRRTRAGIRLFDWLAIHLPVLGDLGLKASVARFTRTFGTLLGAGVPLLQALSIARDTSGNLHIARAIDAAHERVKAGDSVARPLAAAAVFPPMVTSLIEVGEETGALPEMLTRIADTYDDEVDRAVAVLISLLEPMMIVIMAVLVGTIVLALFLPIVRIIQSLS